MASAMACENIWTDRSLYEEAEVKYHESKHGRPRSEEPASLAPLAEKVAVARQRLIEATSKLEDSSESFYESRFESFERAIAAVQAQVAGIEDRLRALEKRLPAIAQIDVRKVEAKTTTEDGDVDLFASESEDEETQKVKEQRLAEYQAKKSKKPALVAKSSIVLDVKPWDDETDMKVMEENVRKIQMDGLLWGASKLAPVGYGINKLVISCVVEDEKVSVDLLQEQIEELEDYVQSVDIAAFNKI